jgi:hypothetical protein
VDRRLTNRVPRAVAPSIDAMVRGASERAPLVQTDGKSGAVLERVVIDGDAYVLKTVDRGSDWIMRQIGDLSCLPVVVWESGLLDLVPDCIDPTLVAAARGDDGTAVLMRDASSELVEPGDRSLPLEQHLRFLDHMAASHAATWGFRDDVGLVPLANRYLFFSPCSLELELARPDPAPVVTIAADGWTQLTSRAPRMATTITSLLEDPWELFDALGREPTALLHGDWKLGNLGTTSDGRTVLVDWSLPWSGPPCADLVHYVALNRSRLPAGHDKEDAFAAYRVALEGHGIATASWWDRQLGLCLLGLMLQLGWEKALGEDEELAWWDARVDAGVRLLATTRR